MENASKALLMAAGILIGILVLSLGIYMFVYFSGETKRVYNQVQADQINQFNSEYSSLEGKSDITIYDVISIARRAREFNKQNDLKVGDYNYIKVTLNGWTKGSDGKLNLNTTLNPYPELTDIDKYPGNNMEGTYQSLIENDREVMSRTKEEKTDEDGNEIEEEDVKAPTYTCTVDGYNDSQRITGVTFKFDKSTWDKWTQNNT